MWIFFPRWIYFHVRNRLKETFLWEKKLQKKLCFSGALQYSPAKTSFSIGFTLFTRNFFQLTKKKVVWNLWYRVNLLEKSAFWSCIYFFHPDQKKEKKNPSWFHPSRKKFLLRKKYLKNPFCVLNQVTRLKKKEKERKIKRFLGKNVSEIFLNSWGVLWNFFFTRRKKKWKEKKKKKTLLDR